MGFINMLKDKETVNKLTERLIKSVEIGKTDKFVDESLSPETLLRDAGKKIKLVTPTSFGTQIEFAKKYLDDEIEILLRGFNYKIKGKSVFIIK